MIRSLAEKKARALMATTHQEANKMRRYFAPASVLPPPGSTRGQTGNRNTAATATNAPNTTPTDSKILTLIPHTNGALAVWKFSTQFTKPPAVTATAQQANPTAPQELSVIQVTTTGAVVQSSDPADVRLVHFQAVQTP